MSQHEWTRDEIRRVGRLFVDRIAHPLTTVPAEPAFRPFPSDVAERMRATPPPADGIAPDEILRTFAETIEPYPFGNGHPRFWGWVNSPPAVMGIFADALAAAMNPSVAGGNHAAVHVERQVIRWFGALVGMPEECVGILVSGGSMASLIALAAARHAKAGFDVRARGLQSGDRRLAVYASQEGHGCV